MERASRVRGCVRAGRFCPVLSVRHRLAINRKDLFPKTFPRPGHEKDLTVECARAVRYSLHCGGRTRIFSPPPGGEDRIMPDNEVAVYWDFENIHASLCDLVHGQGWYRRNAREKQENLVKINVIVEFITGLGRINIHKAYANWTNYHCYNKELQQHAMDLVQLFHRGPHSKNGADIRMAIDVIEDISLNPHINVVVIIGGDSDYISIAQKVRQKGKSIIGIGVRETTNQYWMKACNEFKYYSSLLVKTSATADLEQLGYEEEDLDFDEARELLRKAVSLLSSDSGEKFALKGAIKPMMMRLDPSFDESNYGVSSFNKFLQKCSDMVRVQPGEFDHHVFLVEAGRDKERKAAAAAAAASPGRPYESVLKKQQVRLPHSVSLREATDAAWNVFKESGALPSFDAFRARLQTALSAARSKSNPLAEADPGKIKQLMYKSFAFSFRMENGQRGIALSPAVDSADTLFERVLFMLTRRILDNMEEDEVDTAALAELFYEDRSRIDEVNRILQQYQNH
jgi:uncharacterized LabA/DUF88 family protein